MWLIKGKLKIKKRISRLCMDPSQRTSIDRLKPPIQPKRLNKWCYFELICDLECLFNIVSYRTLGIISRCWSLAAKGLWTKLINHGPLLVYCTLRNSKRCFVLYIYYCIPSVSLYDEDHTHSDHPLATEYFKIIFVKIGNQLIFNM